MMTAPAIPPTPIRNATSFRTQGRRAPIVLQGRNGATAASLHTLCRLRIPPMERRKAVRNQIETRRSAQPATDAVPLSP